MHSGVYIDRYMVLAPVGAGAMGIVYSAYDPELDRKVALKLLKGANADDEQRLRREAQALAKLDHANVVAIHDVGTHAGQLFIAMEFVAGQTLRGWIRAQPERPWSEVVAVFVAAGRGLAAAHGAGLVHRDFKPDNVMLGDDGRVRVMDFGLARAAQVYEAGDRVPTHAELETAVDLDSESSSALGQTLTQSGALLGTLAYMSPEQCEGRPADARADQFGFCVALYEALYGRRPFPSTNTRERLEAIAIQRFAEPTHDSKLAGRVRRILIRGLAWDPDERWPSMDALLAALTDDPRARRRKRVLTALTLLAVSGGVLGLGLGLQREEPGCIGMDAHLEGVWDEPRRRAVEAAIRATQLSYAEDSWVRIARGLDDYTRRWVEARAEACESTRRGEQSERTLDLRMACLDELLEHVRVTVDMLTRADEDSVMAATEAVLELPSLERCADVDTLTLPEDPTVAARVAALGDEVTAAEVLVRMADYEGALALLDKHMDELAALGHPPLELRATLVQGEAYRGLSDHDGAERSFDRALSLALRHRMIPEAARAATEVMVLSCYFLARHEDGRHWARIAEPLVEADGSDGAQAHYYTSHGLCAESEGRYDEAVTDHEAALALHEHNFDPMHPAVATALNNLGFALQRQGRFREARGFNERALAIDEHVHGKDHPFTATSLHNLGNIAKAEGDLSAATEFHERALAIREQALGPDHPDVGGSLNSLGSLAKRSGQLTKARAYYLRALEIFEERFGAEHPYVAGVLSNLGSVSRKLGDFEAAEQYLDRALELSQQRLGPDHPDLGIPLYNLAELAAAREDHGEAKRLFARALVLFERSLGADHPIVADTATNLGLAELELGDAEGALEPLERALEIRATSEAPPSALAQTYFCLARALWDAPTGGGRDRSRARELATRALETSASSEESRELHESIEAWLSAR